MLQSGNRSMPNRDFADHDNCLCMCSMRPDIPEMTDVLLNSYYYEVGERSFMKEALAYKVMGVL